jgi:hypothetical protein
MTDAYQLQRLDDTLGDGCWHLGIDDAGFKWFLSAGYQCSAIGEEALVIFR